MVFGVDNIRDLHVDAPERVVVGRSAHDGEVHDDRFSDMIVVELATNPIVKWLQHDANRFRTGVDDAVKTRVRST